MRVSLDVCPLFARDLGVKGGASAFSSEVLAFAKDILYTRVEVLKVLKRSGAGSQFWYLCTYDTRNDDEVLLDC